MGKLAKGEELYPQSLNLQEEFFEKCGASAERGLRRYLDDIHFLYGHILITEKKKKDLSGRRVTIYRVLDRKRDINSIFKFFMENSNDLSWVLQMVHENDPSFLSNLDNSSKHSIEKSIQEDEGIFIFKSNPFENLEDKKDIFKNLKKAVKNNEYCSIEYKKNKLEIYKNLKCLKLAYLNNNWYLAAEDEDRRFLWLRLSFMQKVGYSENKVSFHKSKVEHYNLFFSKVQNAMTLANTSFQIATLSASSEISIYFRESMKPFLASQKYIRTEEDGSIIFTIEYTQELEILPFIKYWQPNITIIAPVGLKENLLKDLRYSIENYNKDK